MIDYSLHQNLNILLTLHVNKQGIKHAIIRKDLKIDGNVDDSNYEDMVEERKSGDKTMAIKKPSYVFRCGKVGPCDSLKEVLR